MTLFLYFWFRFDSRLIHSSMSLARADLPIRNGSPYSLVRIWSSTLASTATTRPYYSSEIAIHSHLLLSILCLLTNRDLQFLSPAGGRLLNLKALFHIRYFISYELGGSYTDLRTNTLSLSPDPQSKRKGLALQFICFLALETNTHVRGLRFSSCIGKGKKMLWECLEWNSLGKAGSADESGPEPELG